jgi:hypothetical protein
LPRRSLGEGWTASLFIEGKFARREVEPAFLLSESIQDPTTTDYADITDEPIRFVLPCGQSQKQIRHSHRNTIGGNIMRPIAFIVLTVCISLLTGRLLAGDQPAAEDELTRLKREYADVLALQDTSKGEILAIARILRAKPDIAIDQTAASGEYCFNSGHGTMVHFATQPERTPEDIVYEFDASALIAAGLDTSRMQQLPERGQMTPGTWYFLPKGQPDPHHGRAMANPNDRDCD